MHLPRSPVRTGSGPFDAEIPDRGIDIPVLVYKDGLLFLLILGLASGFHLRSISFLHTAIARSLTSISIRSHDVVSFLESDEGEDPPSPTLARAIRSWCLC